MEKTADATQVRANCHSPFAIGVMLMVAHLGKSTMPVTSGASFAWRDFANVSKSCNSQQSIFGT
eukprot:scaffold7831_cov108-Isochrysis_galbana.AAC.14